MGVLRFEGGVAGSRADDQLGLGKGLVEIPGVLDGAHDVIATMDDDSGDVLDLGEIAQQLIFNLKEAAEKGSEKEKENEARRKRKENDVRNRGLRREKE